MKKVKSKPHSWIYVTLSIVAMLAFVLLAHYIFTMDLTQIQTQIYDYMLRIQTPYISKILILFTKSANPVPILIGTLIVCFFLWLKRYRVESLLVLFCILSLTLSNILLKNWFTRERPPFERLIEETGYSFPSGHSMMSFGIAIIFTYLLFHSSLPRWLASFFCLFGFLYTLLIGFSRVYVSVHYLGDVLGGYLAATAVTCLIIAIYEFLLNGASSKTKRGNR